MSDDWNMRAKLRLNGIGVDCIIGDRPDERTRTQHLRIDVEIGITPTAAASDQLEDTIDYAELTESIRTALIAAQCRLIERAAQVVMDCLPSCGAAKVTVTKAGAVTGLDSASVVLERK